MSRFVKTVISAAIAPALFLTSAPLLAVTPNTTAPATANTAAPAPATANAPKPMVMAANTGTVRPMVVAANTSTTKPMTLAQTTDSNISPAEREKIESVVHDYLLKKPEIMVEVMQILQRKQYEEAEKTVKQTQQSVGKYVDALFHQPADPVVGNTKGTITVVEFFDYQCPHCVDMAPVLENVVKGNANVRIVYKEFPIRGPQSEFASRVALAANLQGKYLPVHTAILTANQPLTNDIILNLAKNAGADVDKIKTDMNSKAIDDQIKANIKLAQDLKLFGTPAFFIGKTNTKDKVTYVPGQMNQAQMDKAISDAS